VQIPTPVRSTCQPLTHSIPPRMGKKKRVGDSDGEAPSPPAKRIKMVKLLGRGKASERAAPRFRVGDAVEGRWVSADGTSEVRMLFLCP
jgi:hypothetical protein